jgi:hypothetical protein
MTTPIEDTLLAFLNAVPAIQTIATGSVKKVFAVFAPHETTAPYVTYRRIPPTQRTQSMQGAITLATSHFRIIAWATTYEAARDLANAIRAAVNVPRASITMANVQESFVVDEADVFEPLPELTQHQFFGRYLDIRLRHNE